MNDKQIFIVGLIITVIIILGGVFFLSSSSKEESPLSDFLNKPAPDFTLENYDGKKITLSKLKGKNVIVFFSEGIMCYPACWNQMAAFANDQQFKTKDTEVITIIDDSKSDWKQATLKMPELSKTIVLFDTDKKISMLYNTLSLPSSMHKGQFPGHTYLVLDKKGIVRFVFDDPQMAVRNQELLAEINKL